jgi:hypothetical protein
MDAQTKRYLTIGGGVMGSAALLFGIFKISKKVKLKSNLKSYSKATSTTYGINTIEIAQAIGQALGTAYNSLDPRHWTENDDVAEKAVLKVPKTMIPQLISDYAKLYKRDLRADLQSLLDGWDNVKYLFN